MEHHLEPESEVARLEGLPIDDRAIELAALVDRLHEELSETTTGSTRQPPHHSEPGS